MGTRRISDKRICYSCGSDKTYHTKEGHQDWFLNPPTGLFICNTCYHYLFCSSDLKRRANKKGNERRHYRHQYFKDKHLTYLFDIRCGVCNWCRAVVGMDTKATQLHHDGNKYDHENPLRFTIELCLKCHRKESLRLDGGPT